MVLQVRDINELSRQEVDEIINLCVRRECVSSSDDIQKRLFAFCLIYPLFFMRLPVRCVDSKIFYITIV